MRPRELALLQLGSEEVQPRRRMRGQMPDRIGLELKQRLLQKVADVDPEPEELDAALARIIDELGPPTGPIRALALSFRDDWQDLRANPELVGLLFHQTKHSEEGGDTRGRRVRP
jgi:hypothetical protein